ncbi:hypothetical protein B0H19DRAFT_1257784 [Mycena capillaripes]|nr:hypothetical protein B0H19DRAFT_1257784 [Mycena capillaripes]
MKFAFFTATAAAALAAVAAASIPRDDSSSFSSCGTTIESLVSSSNPAFNCLAPVQLKDVLALGNKNSSVAESTSTVNTWLTAFCGVGSCTADTISQLSNSVNSTCGTGDFNVTDFVAIRETLCLKDTTANTFCTTEGFTQGSTVTNTSDPGSGAIGVLFGILAASSDNFAPCNECAKARYQLRVKAGGSTDFQILNQSCGANFTATLNSTVVGVSQEAVAGDFKSNGAVVFAPTAGLLLLVISGFFALL